MRLPQEVEEDDEPPPLILDTSSDGPHNDAFMAQASTDSVSSGVSELHEPPPGEMLAVGNTLSGNPHIRHSILIPSLPAPEKKAYTGVLSRSAERKSIRKSLFANRESGYGAKIQLDETEVIEVRHDSFASSCHDELNVGSRASWFQDAPLPIGVKKSLNNVSHAASALDKKRQHRFASAWIFLEEPTSSVGAGIFSMTMTLMIIASVGLSLAFHDNEKVLSIMDMIFDCVFTSEVMARLVVCPRKRKFLRNPYNVLDILAVIPFSIRVVSGFQRPEDGSVLQLCLLQRPILRLLKTTRNFPQFRLLTRALAESREALAVPLFMLLVLVFSFSSIFYWFEQDEQIHTVPKAMWFSIVTLSTVGYGHTLPHTTMGSILTILLIVSGVLYMAMPISILGSNFTWVWEDRDKLLLLEKLRQRLMDYGYAEDDVLHAFNAFDRSGEGEIDALEFAALVKDMRLGLSDERLIELFQAFDSDGSGTICFPEFCVMMFPHAVGSFNKFRRDSIQAAKNGDNKSKASWWNDEDEQRIAGTRFATGTGTTESSWDSSRFRQSDDGDDDDSSSNLASKRSSAHSHHGGPPAPLGNVFGKERESAMSARSWNLAPSARGSENQHVIDGARGGASSASLSASHYSASASSGIPPNASLTLNGSVKSAQQPKDGSSEPSQDNILSSSGTSGSAGSSGNRCSVMINNKVLPSFNSPAPPPGPPHPLQLPTAITEHSMGGEGSAKSPEGSPRSGSKPDNHTVNGDLPLQSSPHKAHSARGHPVIGDKPGGTGSGDHLHLSSSLHEESPQGAAAATASWSPSSNSRLSIMKQTKPKARTSQNKQTGGLFGSPKKDNEPFAKRLSKSNHNQVAPISKMGIDDQGVKITTRMQHHDKRSKELSHKLDLLLQALVDAPDTYEVAVQTED